jgi:hypothetical protein
MGLYTLECDEFTTFNYTDKIEVWYNNKCCGRHSIDNGWHVQDTISLRCGGYDDEEIEVTGPPTLTVSPLLQAPYRLWRNDTSILLNTVFQNFL